MTLNRLEQIIFERFSGEFLEKGSTQLFNLEEVKLLMLDAVRDALNKATENVKVIGGFNNDSSSSTASVDKNSILKTIEDYL
jgi:hypothetical protein